LLHGEALAATGRAGEAERAFLAAAELSPDDATPYVRLASLYSTLGHPERARQAIDRAESIDPAHPDLEKLRAETGTGPTPRACRRCAHFELESTDAPNGRRLPGRLRPARRPPRFHRVLRRGISPRCRSPLFDPGRPGTGSGGGRLGDGPLLRPLGHGEPLRQPGGLGLSRGPQLGSVVASQTGPPPHAATATACRTGHARRPPDRRGARRPRHAAPFGGGVPHPPRLVDRGDRRSPPDQAWDRQVATAPRLGPPGRDAGTFPKRERVMDLRDRLRVHLDAETTAIRAGDIGEVMERGDSIRRRRKVLMTATPVVAMAAVVVAFVLVQDDERPGREIERLADGN